MSYIEHEVSLSDTLAGIAVKYNVTIPEIRKANGIQGMGSNVLALYPKLKIPQPAISLKKPNLPNDNKNKNAIIKEFTTAEKCTAFEAKQYLEENDYDLEASINARRQWMSSAKDTIDIPKNTDPFKLTNIAEAIDSSPIIDTKAAKRVNVNVRHRLEKLDDDIFEL